MIRLETFSKARFAHRRRAGLAAAVGVAIAALAPGAASACELPEAARDLPGGLPALADGVAYAELDCGEAGAGLQIWTLSVDADAKSLGVRDDALFDERHTGPLEPLGDAEVGATARVTVLTRAAMADPVQIALAAAQKPYRRFGTLCDRAHFGDPLDCSVEGRRIKMRVDAEDLDKDGLLDSSLHQISVYDGAARLHVISFSTPYKSSPMATAAAWLEVLTAVGALDLSTDG